jgi:hypothetical protein
MQLAGELTINCWTAMAYRGASALDFGEDFGALGLPLAGLWIGVARGEIRLDIVHQFL